jgi:hypothetical protein
VAAPASAAAAAAPAVAAAAPAAAAAPVATQFACQEDAQKLCPGLPHGGGRLLSCLNANRAKASPACQRELAFVTKAAGEVGSACADDIQQLCADVKLGGGRVLKCLASNSAKLSPDCQKVVQQMEEKSAGFKLACGSDVQRLCQFVPQGKGQILACLRSNQRDLAPACQALLQPLWTTEASPPATPEAAPAVAPPAPSPAAAPAAAPGPAPATPPAEPAKN